MKEIFSLLGSFAMSVLPTSPFQYYIGKLNKLPYLETLNWFIPISTFIAIGQAWLVAIGIFYLYQIILRWLKAIG